MERQAVSKGKCPECGEDIFRTHRACENKRRMRNGQAPQFTPEEVTADQIIVEPDSADGDALRQIAALREALMDRAVIRRIIAEEVRKQPARVLEVKSPRGTNQIEGIQHKALPDLIRMLGAGVNVAIYGPAGTGKSYAVKQAATALGLPFYGNSVCSQTAKHEFSGFRDAMGNVALTEFRRAFLDGGVYCGDEADAGNPNVLTYWNDAIANRRVAFPDTGMVDAHDNFLFAMCLNTVGLGKTQEYTGRNAIDFATRSRFAWLHWPIDNTVENAIVRQTLGEWLVPWAVYVQKIRAEFDKAGIKNALVTPRQVEIGAKLLDAGFNVKETLDKTLLPGLSQEAVDILKGVDLPEIARPSEGEANG